MTDGLEFRFWAAVHSIETGEEKWLATFYVMNTSLNRNRWRVTDKALEDALPTLIKKPLGCIPGYRVNHVHKPLQVGKWIKVDKPDGYALATAEIIDDIAWEKISSSEWGSVSVVIKAFKVTCSVCSKDITEVPDEHILSGEGHEIIESFVFDRVDFVEEPAYPQAGVLTLGHLAEAEAAYGVLFTAEAVPFEETMKAPEDRTWDGGAAEARIRRWAGGPDKGSIRWSDYRRAFAWYDRGDSENFGSYMLPHHDIINGQLSVVWRGVAAAMQALLGARGGVDIPDADRRGTYNHLARHYAQWEKTPPEYHASRSNMDGAKGPRSNPKPEEKREKQEMEEQVAELRQELETLKAENETLNTENETLKAENQKNKEKLDHIEAERHQEHVNAAVGARIMAGIVRDRQGEAERLKDLDDATLIFLREDAELVAEKLAKASLAGPKAKYTGDSKSSFDVAVEETRERLFGHRREASD